MQAKCLLFLFTIMPKLKLNHYLKKEVKMFNINTINVDIVSLHSSKGRLRFLNYKFEANDIFVKNCNVCKRTEIKYKNIPESIFKNLLVKDDGWIRINYYATPKGAHSVEKLSYGIESKSYNKYADQIWIPISNFKQLFKEKNNLKFVALRQDRFDLSFGQNLINSLNFPLARIYAGNAGRFILASNLEMEINFDVWKPSFENINSVTHRKCQKISLLADCIVKLSLEEFEKKRLMFNSMNKNKTICYDACNLHKNSDIEGIIDGLMLYNMEELNLIEKILWNPSVEEISCKEESLLNEQA